MCKLLRYMAEQSHRPFPPGVARKEYRSPPRFSVRPPGFDQPERFDRPVRVSSRTPPRKVGDYTHEGVDDSAGGCELRRVLMRSKFQLRLAAVGDPQLFTAKSQGRRGRGIDENQPPRSPRGWAIAVLCCCRFGGSSVVVVSAALFTVERKIRNAPMGKRCPRLPDILGSLSLLSRGALDYLRPCQLPVGHPQANMHLLQSIARRPRR